MNTRSVQQGVVAIEVVALMPVFLLLIIGVLDFARLLWVDGMLDHAARKTVRHAMVHGSASPEPATAESLRAEFLAAVPGLQEDRLQLTLTPEWSSAPDPGTAFLIEARYEFNLWWDILPTPSVLLTADAASSVAQ